MRNIFLAVFLLGLAHTIRAELENVIKYSNADADIVYDGNLVPSDLKEYNLCHLVNCDEEEAIARNRSKQIQTKTGAIDTDNDYGGIDKDYENNYDDDDDEDFEMEEEIDGDDDDIAEVEENDIVQNDFDDQSPLEDYHLYKKPKLHDYNSLDQLPLSELD